MKKDLKQKIQEIVQEERSKECCLNCVFLDLMIAMRDLLVEDYKYELEEANDLLDETVALTGGGDATEEVLIADVTQQILDGYYVLAERLQPVDFFPSALEMLFRFMVNHTSVPGDKDSRIKAINTYREALTGIGEVFETKLLKELEEQHLEKTVDSLEGKNKKSES